VKLERWRRANWERRRKHVRWTLAHLKLGKMLDHSMQAYLMHDWMAPMRLGRSIDARSRESG